MAGFLWRSISSQHTHQRGRRHLCGHQRNWRTYREVRKPGFPGRDLSNRSRRKHRGPRFPVACSRFPRENALILPMASRNPEMGAPCRSNLCGRSRDTEGAKSRPHDLSRIKNRFNVREIKTSCDIADWNAGKIPVAVIHPASAGHGLNLQAGGSTLVWFGLTCVCRPALTRSATSRSTRKAA